METIQELKQKLFEKIAEIEDYDVLLALKEDVAIYQTQLTEEDPYDFPGATDEEREELIAWDKAEKVDVSDCVSLEEFKAAMSKWRMK